MKYKLENNLDERITLKESIQRKIIFWDGFGNEGK